MLVAWGEPLKRKRYADHQMMFEFEERNVTDYGPCEWCGGVSLLASGMVRRNYEPYAIYQVHWTKHQIEKHGAEFYTAIAFFTWATFHFALRVILQRSC